MKTKSKCEVFCLLSSIVLFTVILIHGHYVQATNSLNVQSVANQLGNQFKVNNLSNLLKSVGFEMNLNRDGLRLSFGSNNRNPSAQHGNQAFFPLDFNNLPPHKIIPPSGSMPGFVMIPLPLKNDVNSNAIESTTTEATATAVTNSESILKDTQQQFTPPSSPLSKENKANRFLRRTG